MTDFKLTPHFSFQEATRSHDHPGLVPENQLAARRLLPKLMLGAQLMETVREILGVPIDVHSWYRGQALNKAIGGSMLSQHMKAEAIDWSEGGPDTYESVEASFEKVTLEFARRNVMFGQLIVEHGKTRNSRSHWLHLSLGHPLRTLTKCRQLLRYENRQYHGAGQLTRDPWRYAV